MLLEFNGTKLNSLTSVIGLIAEAQIVTQARLTVLRNGQRVTFVARALAGVFTTAALALATPQGAAALPRIGIAASEILA